MCKPSNTEPPALLTRTLMFVIEGGSSSSIFATDLPLTASSSKKNPPPISPKIVSSAVWSSACALNSNHGRGGFSEGRETASARIQRETNLMSASPVSPDRGRGQIVILNVAAAGHVPAIENTP